MNENTKRGGKREGAGRKPSSGPSPVYHLRLKPEIYEEVKKRGGAKFLKELIEQALRKQS